MPFLEDMAVGAVSELGSCTFTAEDIIRYAKTFDPQPFRVDPGGREAEPLRRPLRVRLAYGGDLDEADDRPSRAVLSRVPAPRRTAAPARALARLQEPEMVEARLRRRHDHVPLAVIATRPSASRPGWGLAFHRNSGVNQHGEEVFAFDGAVFWEMRRSLARASSRS